MVRLNKEDIINEFYSFLVYYNCYDKFFNNIECNIHDIIDENTNNCINFISEAFSWSESTEGFNYWYNKSFLWTNHCKKNIYNNKLLYNNIENIWND